MKGNAQNQMKLSQLKILVAVADCGNFSEAALQLEMSQSAVSHAIAALENHLGVMLVTRGRYGAHLTPTGETVTQHARVIVQQVEEIHRAAAMAKGLKGGQVRVASFRSISTHVLPPLIARFHDRFPQISVSLAEHDDYPQVEQSLREGKVDVGFTFMPTSPDLDAWEIVRDEFVVLLPAILQRSPTPLSWAELGQLTLIMPPTDYIMMQPLYSHAAAHGCRLNVAYEVETDAAIVSLVAANLGASILPRLAAEPIPASIQVYSLPTPLERIIGVATLAAALHPPAVYAFLELLKEGQAPAGPG